MVFFNYATMQMAAKIVYYGPGLCGKTTNLHHIYSRTAPGSRGEMVSLETETDRTLFFDLLPLDVGVIGGFKTRVQLYTVPGQVFYNTTRKLVLKGVDGIVFVADSQKAMREANLESMGNLRSNLAEIAVKLEELPLVFQYNKRDLSNILSLEELERSLNINGQYESYEACAVLGQGVFETLKAVSKHTLRSLKKRMLGEERPSRPMKPVTFPSRPPEPPLAGGAKPIEFTDFAGELPATPRAASGDAPSGGPDFAWAEPPATPPPSLLTHEGFDASDVETVQEFEDALNSLDSPLPEIEAELPAGAEVSAAEPENLAEPVASEIQASFSEAAVPAGGAPAGPEAEELLVEEAGVPVEEGEIGEISFAEAPKGEEVPPETVKHVRVRSNIDILAELEKLRKAATSAPLAESPIRRTSPGISIDDLLAASLNHRKEINRIFELRIPQRDLARGHQVTVGLRLEDQMKNLLGEEKTFSIELHTRHDIEKLLLSLKFHIFGK